jgi:hypothetical protein
LKRVILTPIKELVQDFFFSGTVPDACNIWL